MISIAALVAKLAPVRTFAVSLSTSVAVALVAPLDIDPFSDPAVYDPAYFDLFLLEQEICLFRAKLHYGSFLPSGIGLCYMDF